MVTLFHTPFGFASNVMSIEFLLIIIGIAFLFLMIGMQVNGFLMRMRFANQIVGLVSSALGGGKPSAGKKQGGSMFLPMLILAGLSTYFIYARYSDYGGPPGESSQVLENYRQNADDMLQRSQDTYTPPQENDDLEVDPEQTSPVLPQKLDDNYHFIDHSIEAEIHHPSQRAAEMPLVGVTLQIVAVSTTAAARKKAYELQRSFPRETIMLYEDAATDMTKVFIGDFSDRKAAMSLQRRLKKSGYENFPVDLEDVDEFSLIHFR